MAGARHCAPGHHGRRPATDDCVHPGCAGWTATIPADPGLSIEAGATPCIALPVPAAIRFEPERSAAIAPVIDRDIGPPVPAILHTVLRP
jgi:hypothetical protein